MRANRRRRSTEADRPTSLPLRTWVWRNIAAATLIPVLVVELGLLGAFALSHHVNNADNVAAAKSLAREQLASLSGLEANVISANLAGVEQQVEQLRRRTERAHDTPILDDAAARERARYRRHDSGAVYSLADPDRASMFYSTVTDVDPSDVAKAVRLSQIDAFLKDLVESNDLIVQAYYNTRDSLNRIYPPIDVIGTYSPSLDIPLLNFYYLADAAHNPDRGVAWTDIYVDPAGQGWMTSAIAPVYDGDRLLGVVGVDITISKLRDEVLALDVPWNGYGLLLDSAGTIMAMPAQAERDWGLDELTEHDYQDYVTQDRFKPAQFNVRKRPAFAAVGDGIGGGQGGLAEVDLRGEKLAAWAPVPLTGWSLMVVVPTKAVFAEADAMSERAWTLVAVLMILLALFYAGFFAYLWRRSTRLTEDLAAPLTAISSVVQAISRDAALPRKPHLPIREMDQTADQILETGRILRRRTRDMKAAVAEADAANAAKSQFLANMSHELRTPLNAINGFAEVLEAQYLGPIGHRKYVEYARDIRSSGEHLLALVNDVLDLSKVDAGRLETMLHPVDLPGLLDECARMVDGKVHSRNLTLSMRHGLDTEVTTDERVVRQIVLNLLSNAVKFTPVGGSIEVTDGWDRGGVYVRVCDDGVGMSPEEIPAALDRFVQLDRNNRQDQEGTGLGLPLSLALARTVGGTLDIESAKGRGTKVTLRLPEQPDVPATAARLAAQ